MSFGAMSHADFAGHYRAQAKIYHEKAQRARQASRDAKERFDWIAKLRHDCAANELRRLRDDAKKLAAEHAAQAR